MLACMQEETSLPLDLQQRLEEAFSPIFFHYPNGLHDRTMWTPRDPRQYIRSWYDLAEWRKLFATEHESLLTKSQVAQIFQMYSQQMNWQPYQKGKKSSYYKSCTEVKLRKLAGSVFIAKAIWAIGVPALPSFAPERRAKPLLDRPKVRSCT